VIRGVALGLQAAANRQAVFVVDSEEPGVEQLVEVRPQGQAVLDVVALVVYVGLDVGGV
jgi:hypothetical protein